MGRLDGRVALVTGSGSGIGRATARVLAREGAKVAVGDINAAGVAETVRQVGEAGGQALGLALDVTDEAAWTAAVARVVAEWGRLDVLVNNAGTELIRPLVETTLAEWRRVMAVSLDGAFLGHRAAIPAMLEGGGGAIVNISSIAGIHGYNRQAAYCASKGGIRLLSKAAAVECGERGWPIRVNSVHPGPIDTPMVDGMFAGRDDAQKEQGKRRLAGMALSGRFGEPEDIAEAVCYLASDAAKYVTGTELVVDGGSIAR